MSILFNYVKDYLAKHFRLWLYIAFLLFMSSFICLYYYKKGHFALLYREAFDSPLSFFLFSLLFYCTICIIQSFFTKKYSYIRNTGFWIYIIFGIAIFSLNKTVTFQSYLANIIPGNIFKYTFLTSIRVYNLIAIALPLLFFYLIAEKDKTIGFYGINNRDLNFKPYLVVLPILIITIFISSYSETFLTFYPRFEYSGYESLVKTFGTRKWIAVLQFEVAYGLYFLRVELFFRGFLVLGFAKFMGKDVILPMAGLYCILHFGKPMGEAIMAIFGGYLLGIITYYSKNIYGGLIWHLAFAWFMELFAFLQIQAK